MSDDWIEDSALRFEGFTDAQIIEIKAAIPKANQVLGLVEKNKADLTHMYELVLDLLPTAYMITNVIKGRMT